MKKETDYITGLILKWQKGGEGYPEILRIVSKKVIEYPRLHGYSDPDSCCDFYLFFYSRMLKLIQDFEYRGLSFMSLLKNTLEWQLLSFYRKKRKADSLDSCLKYDSILEAETVCDSDTELQQPFLHACEDFCCRFKLDRNGRVKSDTICRRLVMLALKSANELESRHIAGVSKLTGCPQRWLEEAVDRLRLTGFKRSGRQREYDMRANRAYMELCRLQKELSACFDGFERRRIASEIEIVRKRLRTAYHARTSVRLHPTNCEVAEIMHMPKGSIDSGLYHLKKDLGGCGYH